ncbi:MAG: phosphoribosylformylglycinamidine cyclo-ligase [Zetaproteobacteria bacterium]|nr:MAG: phosphoribosylformylglycinamidine cyclo-ligase [Zetaproteobacteria bacterium]
MSDSTAGSDRTLRYADAGVDIDAGNAFVGRIKQAVASTTRPEVLGGIGGFGALFQADFSSMEQPVLAASTDGVGTKLLLLQRYGRPQVAGIDVVAMCLNDLAAQGAQPLFFLDYLATGRLDGATLAGVVEGIAEACRRCGCALIGGETAEMPGMYGDGEYDVAGFAVGVVEKSRIVDGGRIGDGDLLLGLASDGVHANGFSLVRKLLEIGDADPVRDLLDDGGSVLDALLAPTRLYVPALAALRREGVTPHGCAHITGGGIFDNLERILPDGLAVTVDPASWPVPPIFRYLLALADVPFDERYRTFNMGIGFVLVVAPEDAGRTESVLADAGERVYRIGRVHARDDRAVTLIG